MRRRLLLSSLLLVLVVGSQSAWAGTPGIFRGFIVAAPVSQDHYSGPKQAGWLYVEGRNHMVRRVALAQAEIIYAAEVPAAERQKDPARSLVKGAEVRVTAEQDGNGEWRAQRVEILKIAPAPKEDERAPRVSS
jgi:hypothetical protein